MTGKEKGAVLITGASAGIGRASALLLDRVGYRVFAGVRRPEDAGSIAQEASHRLVPLMLDITNGTQIGEAVQQLEKSLRPTKGLAALVNNAGTAIAGPIEFLPVELIRHHMEVNVIAQIAVTQACLPLLRCGRGRIIQIGSAIQELALPFLGAYVASRVAMAAITDTFRRELRWWHIPVSHVLPGVVRTSMWNKYPPQADQLQAGMPAFAKEQAKAFMVGRELFDWLGRRGMSPEVVAEAVLRALEARRPRMRYAVGMDAKLALLVPRLLPTRLLDWAIHRVLTRRT